MTLFPYTTLFRSVKRLPEGLSNKEESLGHEYEPIKEGYNDWKVPGWCGPVHQSGNHRIVFRLYALDDEVHLGNKVFQFNYKALMKDINN